MRRRFLSVLRAAVALPVFCLPGLLPLPAAAQGAAPGVEMARAQANVYLAGGDVRPSGPVAGDFMAAGGRVTIDQPVGGDAGAAAGAVDVRAAVQEDLRAVGGDIAIDSSVGGEVFATGANVVLRPGARVARGARLYGANVVVEGRVEGRLHAAAQKVRIDGEVGGDVRIAAEEVELGPTARLGGALHYAAASALKKAEGATVAGAITREEGEGAAREQRRGERAGDGAWTGGVFTFLALLACAAVFLLLAPAFAAQAPLRIQASPWLALGLGVAALAAIPLMAVLLFITLLGIPLGIAVLALLPVLLLGGFTVGALAIARLLPPALRRSEPAGFGAELVYLALALLLLLLLARIPVAGVLVLALVSLAGVGACVLELHGRRKGPGSGAPAEPRAVVAPEAPRHA